MRRRYKRVSIKKEEIRVETVIEAKAEVSDLSMLGIGVKTPKRLKSGSSCLVSIGSNGSLMILRGTAVWERFAGWSVKPGGQAEPLFSAGIRFDNSRQDLMKQICGEECDTARAARINTSGLTVLLSFAESLTVINLSYGGLLAESLNPMEPGNEHNVRLFLPASHEPIKCMAKIASCEAVKGKSEKTYHIGFEFVSMDYAQADRLKEFILMRSAI